MAFKKESTTTSTQKAAPTQKESTSIDDYLLSLKASQDEKAKADNIKKELTESLLAEGAVIVEKLAKLGLSYKFTKATRTRRAKVTKVADASAAPAGSVSDANNDAPDTGADSEASA